MLRDRKALDAFSLRINKGENVAIIGPNGSGKSTLIKTITRNYYPLAGDDVTFRILGEEQWDVIDLRGSLGIVGSDLQEEYHRGITATDAILSGFFSSIGLFTNHRVTTAMRAKVRRILAFLEIPHLAEVPMDEMSSGEARRVLIGRALVHDPRALILDEPTNSLDAHALHHFRVLMRKIASSGKNIVLVTHHLHDIIPEISRVVLIKDGRVFKQGAKEDMLTGSILSELFTIPLHVEQKDGYYYGRT